MATPNKLLFKLSLPWNLWLTLNRKEAEGCSKSWMQTKQLLAQTSWKRKAERKDKTGKAVTLIIFELFLRLPFTSFEFLQGTSTTGTGCTDQLLQIFLPLHIIIHTKKGDTNLCHQLPTALLPHFSSSSIYCRYPDVLCDHQGQWAVRILGNKILWILPLCVTWKQNLKPEDPQPFSNY